MYLSDEDVKDCNIAKAKTLLLLKIVQLYFEKKYLTDEYKEARSLLSQVKDLGK